MASSLYSLANIKPFEASPEASDKPDIKLDESPVDATAAETDSVSATETGLDSFGDDFVPVSEPAPVSVDLKVEIAAPLETKSTKTVINSTESANRKGRKRK